jgi:cyclohexanecarboxylate-CoA ligase
MRPPRLSAEMVERYTRPGLWEDTFLDTPLRRRAATDPDRLAVVDRGRRVSYAELDAAVDQVAAALVGLGVRSGDVVSWQLPNWLEASVVHLATIRCGAVSNPIIPIYRAHEVEFILRQARSRVVVVPDQYRAFAHAAMVEQMRDRLPDLAHVVVVGEPLPGQVAFTELTRPPTPGLVEVERDPNDFCFLLYTSGTTSDPKGVVHTHNTLDYENRSYIEWFGLTRDDVVFMPSPVGHITGVMHGIQMPPMLGCAVVFQDVWDPAAAVRLMADERCTFTVAATPFLHGVLDEPSRAGRDLSALRIFNCGGADVPAGLVRRATEELSCFVTRIYGSTEYPTAISSSPADPLDKRATTDGRPLGPVEIRLTDESGRDVPTGEEGELRLRGPELFLGYLDPALDAETFDDDGWFVTGDLGRRDEGGFVTITGRRKDIILRGGENISAKEVEDHLFDHPSVAEIAVIGYPDPVMVERVAAVVVPSPREEVRLDELAAWLRDRGIAMQKIPERLIVVPDLPRTPSGKIQKFRLREMFAGPQGDLSVGQTRSVPARAGTAPLATTPAEPRGPGASS